MRINQIGVVLLLLLLLLLLFARELDGQTTYTPGVNYKVTNSTTWSGPIGVGGVGSTLPSNNMDLMLEYNSLSPFPNSGSFPTPYNATTYEPLEVFWEFTYKDFLSPGNDLSEYSFQRTPSYIFHTNN